MMNQLKFILPIFVFITACQPSKMKVDLIVTNAKVYTMDEAFSMAESFAVLDGKFLAIGSNQDISSKYIADQVIDCQGKLVYPGFIDAHCHFFGYGLDLIQYADLTGSTCQDEILMRIQEHQKQTGGAWVLGRGWDQNLWPDKHFPSNEQLNELFPDTPVYLVRIDGHAAWCNRKALQLAGINATTKVKGGDILLKNGQPSGVLIDNAMELVFRQIPVPGDELKTRALQLAQKNCFAVGLTSVTDCGLPKSTILLIDSLQRADSLKMQMNIMMDPSRENREYFLKNGPYITERMQVRSLKLYADGALGSRGAYLLADYSDDPGNRGLLINTEAYFDSICQEAYDAGFQVATHCIGDGANHFILNIYEKYLKGRNDLRWRIEHAQVVAPEDFGLFGKYSVVPSVQATHATSDMLWADERLGADRIKGAYAYRQLMDQNGWIPNGTDFPIEDIGPLKTFYAAVFRKNMDGVPEGGFQMENALTREQSLRSMTVWAAKAGFEEKEKGSIETGKSADFVVLDTDLMNCGEKEVLDSKILKTVVQGEVVYDAKP